MRATTYLLGLALTAGLTGMAVAEPPVNNPPVSAQGNALDWCARLVSDLGDFQEDIAVESPGPKGKELYQQAGNVLEEAVHLQKSLQTNASAEHLQKHVAEMDQDMRQLMDGVAALGPQARALRRSASRVNYLEQQLYGALTPQADTSGEQGQEAMVRQIHLLAAQAGEFNEAVQYAAQGNPDGRQLADDAGAFAEACEHFHKALEGNVNPEHLRRDFAKVNERWGRTVADLQTFPPRRGNRAVFVRAQKVSAVYTAVFQQLKIEGERTEFRDHD